MNTLDTHLQEQVLQSTGASSICAVEPVQTLWSGFGQIVRLTLSYPATTAAPQASTVIVKHVQPPVTSNHPRGWNSDTSTLRKLESYRVETHWYRHYAAICNPVCTVPRLLGGHTSNEQTWLVLEDLDVHFPARYAQLTVDSCKPCLRWLARFHAHHFEHAGQGLWNVGSYWHLETRQDELAAMPDGELKQAAVGLDIALNNCTFQTLVHGDAKVANFCFSQSAATTEQHADEHAVAMVDFQYVGRGCGMRDVVYFLGSCLPDSACEQHAPALLDVYFTELRRNLPLAARQPVEEQWRALYPIAWADFNRFLAGWMPEHPKINPYMHSMTAKALTLI